MLYVAYIIIYVFVFAIGAVIGSFLNVLIYRLPRGLNFVKGFSFCPSCEHRLYPKDLVPIFSYLFLRGKCRYCGVRISPRYMIVELICGGCAMAAWSAFMPPLAFFGAPVVNALPGSGIPAVLIYFIVLCCLITISYIDHDTMEIPDSLSIAIAVCGVLAIWLGPDIGLKSHLIGLAVASVPLFIIAFFIEGAFGFGDVKLMAAAGLFLGWQSTLVALFIGIIIGGVYGIYLLLSKKKEGKEHFAFGPALCVGIGIAMFAGNSVIDWYLNFL